LGGGKRNGFKKEPVQGERKKEMAKKPVNGGSRKSELGASKTTEEERGTRGKKVKRGSGVTSE